MPGSTSVLLGYNEMRALNLDLQVSELLAPNGGKLLHTREREDETGAKTLVTTEWPLQQKPKKCSLKDSVDSSWREELDVMRRTQESAAQEIAEKAPELMASTVEISPEPAEADLLMTACDIYDGHDGDAHQIALELNQLSEVRVPLPGGGTAPSQMTWEAVSGAEYDALELERANQDREHPHVWCLELLLQGKYIDTVDVSASEEAELTKECKPEGRPPIEGICPAEVEPRKKPRGPAVPLVNKWTLFWAGTGRCGDDENMKYENLKGPQIEIPLKPGMEDVSWFHGATYGEAHRPVVDEYLDKLLARGFIGQATSSKTVSRLLLVRKARGPITAEHPQGEDRGWRVCLDARKLNSVTENVLVHLPSTEEVMLQLSSTLHGGLQRSMVTPRAQYVNVCDYSFGFHGIRYKPGLTQDLCTFSTQREAFLQATVWPAILNPP